MPAALDITGSYNCDGGPWQTNEINVVLGGSGYLITPYTQYTEVPIPEASVIKAKVINYLSRESRPFAFGLKHANLQAQKNVKVDTGINHPRILPNSKPEAPPIYKCSVK